MAGEGNRSRNKGRSGEAEVAALWRVQGFDVRPMQRNLKATGDHLIQRPPRVSGAFAAPTYERDERLIYSETKRTETARPWAWMAQAEREAPAGAVPVVSFRKSRSKWYAMLPLEDLARLLA